MLISCGYGLNAHQLQSQSAYAIEDAVEVGLVDLSCQDRLPPSNLHLHPFEGSSSESFADLFAHHYPVDCPSAVAQPLFGAALHNLLGA